MKTYYYINASGQQVAVSDIMEFRNAGITGETMVWCEGMTTWMPAKSLPELQQFLPPIPPSFVPNIAGTQLAKEPVLAKKPQNWMWLGILSTLLCCLPIGIVSIFYASKVDPAWRSGEYKYARDNSDNAEIWGWIAVGVGFIIQLMTLVAALYH